MRVPKNPVRLGLSAVPVIVALLAAGPAFADPCEAPLPKAGERFSGEVKYVGDGDSLCVETASGLVEVRLADFYAPELSEVGGPEAKRELKRVAMWRRLDCVAGRRSYDRVVAVCRRDGVSVGEIMKTLVEEGGRGR